MLSTDELLCTLALTLAPYPSYPCSKFNQDISMWNVAAAVDIRWMFIGAEDFDQNLCAWGDLLSNETLTSDAFTNTKCPLQDAPNLTVTPAGPFCYPCD